MTAIRPQEVERFLNAPDPSCRVVRFYGPDTGLVSERAGAFAARVIGGGDDPFALVKLDSAALSGDPGRLADEANTVPLFGGTRAIWLRADGGKAVQTAVEAVLAAPPRDAFVILEAGDLKKGVGLRRLCENARGAAAIACYSDSGAALDRLVDDELALENLSIDRDARAALKTLLGADRLASRNEVRKLALYARGTGRVDLDTVRAVVGDAGAFAIDDAVDAVAGGDPAGFDRAFRRLVGSGTAGFVVAGACLRHLQLLHRLRGLVEAGGSVEAALDAVTPPLFFQRRPKVGAQLAAWTSSRLAAALERLDGALFESRIGGVMADTVLAQAMLAIAVQARPRR